jgi:hypothetical protein
MRQAGLFGLSDHLKRLSAYGDPLEELIPTCAEADSRLGFSTRRKSESVVPWIGGREHGIGDRLAGGF